MTTERDDLVDAVRLATEAIEALDEQHPAASAALILRSRALRALGRDVEADADLDRARQLNPDDPNALLQQAQEQLRANDPEGAIQTLRRPAAEGHALLLALRAEALAKTGQRVAAKEDLDAARRASGEAYDEDAVRLAIADAAVDLGDIETADEMVRSVADRGRRPGHVGAIEARVAFARGEIDRGVELYRAASSADPTRSPEYLTELGAQLLRAGASAAAASVFAEMDVADVPRTARPIMADAFMQGREYAKASALIDLLASGGPLPAWAVGVAVNLALLREDVEEAIVHLTELTERGNASPQVPLQLARCLAEVGKAVEARVYLDQLPTAELEPVDKMLTAQLYQATGETDKALDLAYHAFREGSDDPQIHRAFVVLVMTSQASPPTVSSVEPNSHIRLVADDGTEREITVLADDPIDPLRGEMSLQQATAAGLTGKRVADRVARSDILSMDTAWVVQEIKPALFQAAQQAAANYSSAFPGEPFFVESYSMPEGSPREFAPIVRSLESRREQIEGALNLYHERGLPIGFIASIVGVPVARIIELAAVDARVGPLRVEWDDPVRFVQSEAIASTAGEIVVARSALETAHRLGLLNLLADRFSIVTAASVRDELRQEIVELERIIDRGESFLVSVSAVPTIQETPPNDPGNQERLERARNLLDWLLEVGNIQGRPLALIQSVESRQEEIRQSIGKGSYDAVALAEYRAVPLYADDLGLRRVSITGEELVPSFSTISVLSAMLKAGLIQSGEYDSDLLSLALRQYRMIVPTASMLELALERSGLTENDRRSVFGLLGGGLLDANEAGRIAGQVLRAIAIAPVQVVRLEKATELVLGGMAVRWPRPLVAQIVARSATRELVLLPTQLDLALAVVNEFLRSSSS